MNYATIDPTTGQTEKTFDLLPDDRLEAVLRRAAGAFQSWRRQPISSRAERMRSLAEEIENRRVAWARLMALEMGKPVAQGVAEANKCAWVCRHFATNGERFLAESELRSDGSRAVLRHDPIGPVLAIMPWNFPFWQFYRFAVPALMAGNVALLKHAPNTPQCALAIEKVMRDCGFPEGVVQSVFIDNEQAAAVIGDHRVRGVTLTGSTRAGREVAATAGRHLKTMVMELGGSDPFIVFDDADLAEAVRVGALSRCLNNGQSCIAAKRFLVHKAIYDRFRDDFVAAMREQIVGPPLQGGVDIGPLARHDLRQALARQVESSVSAGAELLCGGTVDDEAGFFYPPTVLHDAPEGSPALTEELFGPAAVLVKFGSEDEAIGRANETDYGLGASVWTANADRAQRLVQAIDAGAVFVNGLVKSDPRLPFGGTKDSGFGKELGREGMLEFVNRKTIWIA